jgi:hypothetical protein
MTTYTTTQARVSAWSTPPREQGQTIHTEYSPAGEAGLVRRRLDRSVPREGYTYAVAQWSASANAPDYAPWNGVLGVRDRWRRISEAEANRLLAEEA